MTFERSALGQANRAIFYNVDWIIYTEGGSDEVETARSFDSLFWSGVFSCLCAPLKFRAIPRGGKSQLIPLAQEVQSGALDRVIVAMDRDYDDFFGQTIDHDRVVYTFGYSYENDVFWRAYLLDLFDSMCPEILDKPVIEALIDGWCDEFFKAMRWPIKADIFAKHHEVPGFDREKCQRYMQSNAYGNEPQVSHDRVSAEVVRISADCRKVSKPQLGLPNLRFQDVYGHLWEVFTFRMISCLHSRFSRSPKPSFDSLRVLAIKDFQVRLLREGGADEIGSYYTRVASAAVV